MSRVGQRALLPIPSFCPGFGPRDVANVVDVTKRSSSRVIGWPATAIVEPNLNHNLPRRAYENGQAPASPMWSWTEVPANDNLEFADELLDRHVEFTNQPYADETTLTPTTPPANLLILEAGHSVADPRLERDCMSSNLTVFAGRLRFPHVTVRTLEIRHISPVASACPRVPSRYRTPTRQEPWTGRLAAEPLSQIAGERIERSNFRTRQP